MIYTEVESEASLAKDSQESLRYGDSIYLVGKVAANKSIQLVNSYISSPFHQIVKLDDFSYGENANPLPDLHMSAFRVLYPNFCTTKGELLMSHKDEKEDSKINGKNLSQLEKEAKVEFDTNKIRQKNYLKSKIVYGNVIQLQHYYSGKYLGVSDNHTSIVDRTLLKVSLFDTNGEHVQFKISPKCKVRAIGDKIRIEDEIILENVKCQQYLHYSEIEKSDSFFEGKEINASAEDSTFTIYSHIRLNNDNDDVNNIRGGSVIRLYHLQVQCYVVAPGPGWDQGKEVTTDEVHLRARKIMLGDLKPPSTSAITYWQVENTKSPISGDVLKYDEPCRIKHMLTQRYLSIEQIDDQFQMKLITLADDISGECTQFHFTSVIDKCRKKLKDELIKFGNCARLYHPATKTWVKGTKDEFQGKSQYLEQLVTRGIKWDDASCYQIKIQSSKGSYEAYKLEKVDEQLLDYFHYTIGYLPVIKCYLVTYDHPKTTREIERSLKSLANWMQNASNQKDRKNRQKLLRNLGIIELLMEIQEIFVQKIGRLAETKDYEIRKSMIIMIYTVIEAFLKGNSRKNENYTAKYIDRFKNQFGMNLHAESTLIELIRDNCTIINALSNDFEEFTVILFEELTKYKNPQIFDYFGVMCVFNKGQFQNNQFVLSKRLSERPIQDFMFFMQINKFDAENPNIIATSPFTDEKLHKYLSDYVPIDQSIDKQAIEYLVGQLDFLSNLCKGNNSLAIDMLEEKFSFEILFSGLRDEKIHPIIRSKFAQLLSTMYIDVGYNRANLENLPLTFVFIDCREDIEDSEFDEKPSFGECNISFNKMKNWLRNFFEHLQINYYEDCIHVNQFTASILDVLLLFVKFGYYTNMEDINFILSSLLRIVNGFKDKHLPKDAIRNGDESLEDEKEERLIKSKGDAAIYDIMKKCLRVFELFMNLRKYRMLQLMLSCYREFREQFEDMKNRRKTVFQFDDNLAHHLNKLHNEDLLFENKVLAQKLNDHLNNVIIASTAYEYENIEGINSFQSILLDLTKYEDCKLSGIALRLLNVKYSMENDLFLKAIQIQVLINPSSVQLFNNFRNQLPRFRLLLKSSFTNPNKSDELIEILNECIRACKLSKYPKKTNPQNQNTLFNFGLIEDVMNILEQFLGESSSVEKDNVRELVKVSCTLLQHLSKDNLQIQNKLCDRLEILTSGYLFNIAPIELGNLLTQLFTGAKLTIMDTDSKEIQLICSPINLFQTKENTPLHIIPSIIEILKAFAKVEEIDYPVHLNQIIIMKKFMQMKHKDINKFLGLDNSERDFRNRLLTSNDLNEGELMQLEIMLSTFDLMASLCEGDNQQHLTVCQSMISAGELLEILNNTDLPYARKFQFASFFNWVYLNTQRRPSMYDSISIQKEPEFWSFLNTSNSFLEEFTRILSSQSTHHLIDQESIDKNEVFLNSEICLPDATSHPLQELSSIGSLSNYLWKGVLPIIVVFYTHYLTKIDQVVPVIDCDIVKLSMDISKNLIELAIKFQPFIETKHQTKLLYNAPLSILGHEDLIIHFSKQSNNVIDNEKLLEFKSLVDNEENFVPQSVIDYNQKYHEEIMLNYHFNSYVKHMQRAYWGKNTAKAQIGAKNMEKYSNFLDPASEYPALDSIPLGPNFQEHLNLFFKHKKNSCYVNKKLCMNIILQLKYSYENYSGMDEREKIRQESFDLRSLQLMRGAILNEIKHIEGNLNSKRKEYNSEMEKVVNVQNDIENIYNTCTTLFMLTDHTCETVSFQSISLLIDMLYDRNRYIQENMQCLAVSNEGKFLQKVNSILYHGGSSIKEYRCQKIEIEKRKQCFEKSKLALNTLMEDITTGTNENNLQFGNDIVELKSLQITEMYQKKLVGSSSKQSKDHDILKTKALTTVRLQIVNKEKSDEMSMMSKFRKIELVFKLLGLMCDGHHKFMQDYFRQQNNSAENINLIYKAVNLLMDIHTEITKYNISLVTVVFRSIIEFVDGNYLNKMDICDARIVDVINHIFQIPIQECTIGQEVDLYKSIILFLQVIIEETSLGTKELAKDVYSLIDLTCMHRVIGRLYEIKLGKECQSDKFYNTAEDYMFRLYHFILQSKEFDTVSVSDQARFENINVDSKAFEAWFYCKKNSYSVEIMYEDYENNSILNKVRFKSTNSSLEDVFEIVKWKINRESPEEKLRDFLEWFKAVKKADDYSKELRNFPFINIYIQFQSLRKRLFLFWTFVVNIFILVTWYCPCDKVSKTEVNGIVTYDCNPEVPISTLRRPLDPQVPDWYHYIFYPIGVIHLFLALDILVLFFIVNGKNFYIPDIFHRIKSIRYDPNEKYKFKWRDPKCTKYLKINIFGSKVAFMCIIFLSSLLSLPLRGYLYPICLLYVLEMSEILRRVLLAVAKNGKSLVFVAFFGCIILYIFSVIAFALFSLQAQSTINPDSEAYIFCHTLYECFVTIGRWGLLDTIGLFLPQRSMNFTGELDRIIFDLLFFIVVNTIGLNIVFGIIVDSFSQLRDEKSEQEKDMNNFCFICGLENYVFDRKGNGFRNHVKNEHNMWNYYSFFLYLDSIHPSDHTAIEGFVFNKLKEDDIAFFPKNRARCIVEDNEENDNVQKIIKELQKQVEIVGNVNIVKSHLKSK